MSNMRFAGKTALITGSSSGIGADAAIAMAKEGASVVVNYPYFKEASAAEQIANEIRNIGAKVIVCQADLRNENEVKTLVDMTVKEFGAIDILVNCAGMFQGQPFLETTEEIWEATFSLNIRAEFFCCKHVIPHMLKKGKGVIVNISSLAGVTGGNASGVAYVCSKHAVIGLTRQIVSEFGKKGIRANTVCPGTIVTPMTQPALEIPEIKAYMENVPAGRIGSVNDTTKLILFLASDDSEYIYGDAIVIDGGLFEYHGE